MYSICNSREECPMRHKNGNCLPIGGFCTAVNDAICDALHDAFDKGYIIGRKGEPYPINYENNVKIHF